MASALRCIARHRPLLLILDDLHWADRSSVKLLQFLASEGRSSSLLFLATFREVEPSASPDVARLLGELAGLGLTVPLRGLTEAEVSELVADRADVAPRPQLVRAVYEATHGNPFYVDEVVRLLVAERRLHDDGAEGAPLPIPMGVRAGISRRVDALGEPGAAVLAAAAVGGREIDLAVLARATGMSRDDLLGLLEAAERLGFVARARAIGSRFAFVHALVQEALYEGLSQGERAAWHHRIGEAIEALRARDLEPHLAELAHHFGRAAGGGAAATKAVEYGIRAGEASLRQLAFEKAEVELERSLASLDLLGGDTAAERCRIALGIAEARRGSGDVEGMTESFRQGIDLARGLTPEIFADAVLRLSTARHESFFVDQLVVGRLEEALERLPPGPSALRARCLARLGAALHLDPGSVERRSALTDEAIAIARSLGDRPTLAWVLMMRIIASLGPDNLEQRLALAGEIMRIADETGDSVARLEAETWRIHDLLELGDIEAVHLAIQSFARLAERLKQPVYLWHVATWRVMRALLEGRLLEAESLLGDALVAGQRAQQQSALLRYGEGLLMLRYEQGRMRELEGLFATLHRVPFVEMPQGLTNDVQQAIRARAASRENVRKPVALTGPRLKMRLAMVFAAGIAAGVIGWGALTGILNPEGPGRERLVGTMMPSGPPRAGTVSRSWSSGSLRVESVVWRSGSSRWLRLRVEGPPADVELRFDPEALSPATVRQSEPSARVVINPGRIQIQAQPPGDFTLEFGERTRSEAIQVTARAGKQMVADRLPSPPSE